MARPSRATDYGPLLSFALEATRELQKVRMPQHGLQITVLQLSLSALCKNDGSPLVIEERTEAQVCHIQGLLFAVQRW